MTVVFVVIGIVAFGVGGALSRRFVVVFLPPLLWPLYYAGLAEGWWGDGLGDGWPLALALVVLLSSAAGAAGVALARSTDAGSRPARGQSDLRSGRSASARRRRRY